MGKLDEAIVYLSGPLDYCSEEEGIGWRREFISLIKKNNLNIKCIDPTNKPVDPTMKCGENDIEKKQQEQWQKDGEFKKIQDYVRKFRRLDLRFVDIADILVARIIPGISQFGTSNEIFESEHQHKPRLVICEGKLHKLPRWLFPIFDFNDVFENVSEVIDRLIKINSGEYPIDDKWVLVRPFLNKL